jgi:hypothetical protein
MVAGISGAAHLASRPALGIAVLACAAVGLATGAIGLFRAASREEGASPAWAFFLLANLVEGFAKKGPSGYAVGIVAALALLSLAAIRIHQVLKRRSGALSASDGKV